MEIFTCIFSEESNDFLMVISNDTTYFNFILIYHDYTKTAAISSI